MKKLLIVLMLCAMSMGYTEAKDYVKMQIKEMQKAQKYGTTQKLIQNQTDKVVKPIYTNLSIKDPKIMKFGDYDKISDADYEAKIKKDEKLYSKTETAIKSKTSKAYKTQSDSEDYYKVYRIAEKIIRANKLDYINWRIAIIKDTEQPNAYTKNTNYIAITTAMLDTFRNNDDALALVIGHEMGHALLGHQARKKVILEKMARMQRIRGGLGGVYTSRDALLTAVRASNYSKLSYLIQEKRLLAETRKMEFSADAEGARLAMCAGYNLDNGINLLSYINTFSTDSDRYSTHPAAQKRIDSFNENRKYYPDEWKDKGKYNIYNSEVLPAQLSSDRKSMVISVPDSKLNADKYYSPETMNEIYARLGYMCYKNGEFTKSLEYFNDLFNIDQTNASAYLYASYASEYLHKNTNDSKYLKLARDYANKAYSLDSKNKYIKEQIDAL